MTAEPILALRNVSAGYGDIRVLEDVSLEVFAGEFVTILGANGVGKRPCFARSRALFPPAPARSRWAANRSPARARRASSHWVPRTFPKAAACGRR